MICPDCHMNVPDGSAECPNCARSFYLTRRLDAGPLRWCSVCGALVPSGSMACPKCATPVRGAAAAVVARRIPDPEPRAEAPAEADLESAIPATGAGAYSASSVNDMLPRLRHFVVAASAAILIVGGTLVAITHPWDPNANDITAKTPFDTSNAGSPGVVDTLDAQDKGARADDDGEEVVDPVFDSLHSQYEAYKGYADQISANEDLLRTKGIDGTYDERSAGLSAIREVSLAVSNSIASVENTSDGSGAYTETIANLSTLGNWLRNRCDALTEAWNASLASEDPSSDASLILGKISANSAYQQLYEQNVTGWEPVSALGSDS